MLFSMRSRNSDDGEYRAAAACVMRFICRRLSASARACWLGARTMDAPKDKRCDSGSIPLPALVESTGAPTCSAKSVNALRVPTAPPPTRIRGRFARARRSAASSIAAGSGMGKDGARRGFQSASTGSGSTSLGSDR